MTEPRIQYAQTQDGVSIAFWTIGEGEPLVYMPVLPFSHCQGEWQLAELRSWYERLAEKRMVVRYDCRGFGSSQRNVSDYSLEAHMRDIEAVADHLGLERFALWSGAIAGPMAIAYAVHHPERVSHLLLWCSWAGASDFYESPRARVLRATRDTDWEMYTETVAHAARGWGEVRESEPYAVIIREGATKEAARAAMDIAYEFDVTALLPQVKTPTLLLHRREAPYPDVDVARGLASRIPNARLAVLEGSALAPMVGDGESVASAVDEFLGDGEEAAAKSKLPEPSAFRTVLFTDVEGSTSLTDRLGDAKARELLREHEHLVRDALKSHGGSEVKTLGDGFMASFSSATKALECASAIQSAFAERNESADEPIRVRIGLNAGEPIAEDDPGGRGDLFGTAVNMAARIASKAEGGEIVVADVVRQLVAGKEFLFNDRGDTELRGFEDPVRVYEVRWED